MDSLAKILVPYKEAVLEAPTLEYNKWVQNKVLNRKKAERKLRKGFRFHYEVTQTVCNPFSTLGTRSGLNQRRRPPLSTVC